MEVYEAKYNYVKERDDVLSFLRGERFYITSKTNEKWWAAKKVTDNSCGYVPSVYLQPCVERVIGRLIPEGRRDTKEHHIHLQALAEIHKKIKPLPAHVIGQALGVELHSSDEEDEQPVRSLAVPSLLTPSALSIEGLVPNSVTQSQISKSHKRVALPVPNAKAPLPLPHNLPTPPTSPLRQMYKKHSWPSSKVTGGESLTALYYPFNTGTLNVVEGDKAETDLPEFIKNTGTLNVVEGDKAETDLPEFNKNMSPPPMASPPPPPPDYDMEDDSTDNTNMPFHHKLNSSGRYISVSSDDSSDLSPTYPGGDEALLIKPKPVPNPIKGSKEHQQLHREFKFSVRNKAMLPQRPELVVVQRERKLEEKKKEMEEEKRSRRTSMEVKLLERLEKEKKEEEKEMMMSKVKEQEEETKPEFMKVRLKQTNSLPKS